MGGYVTSRSTIFWEMWSRNKVIYSISLIKCLGYYLVCCLFIHISCSYYLRVAFLEGGVYPFGKLYMNINELTFLGPICVQTKMQRKGRAWENLSHAKRRR